MGWVTYVSEGVHGAAGGEGRADALGVPCQAAAGEATGFLGCWGSCGEGGEGRQGGCDAEHCEWCLLEMRLDREFFFFVFQTRVSMAQFRGLKSDLIKNEGSLVGDSEGGSE